MCIGPAPETCGRPRAGTVNQLDVLFQLRAVQLEASEAVAREAVAREAVEAVGSVTSGMAKAWPAIARSGRTLKFNIDAAHGLLLFPLLAGPSSAACSLAPVSCLHCVSVG